MRILSILWGWCGGGIDKVVETYMDLDSCADIMITTACIYGLSWDTDVHYLQKKGVIMIPIQSRGDFSWIARTSQLIDEQKADLVFVHGFNGPIVARFCQIYLKRNFPFVCSYHGKYHAPKSSRVFVQPIFNGALHYVYRKHADGIVAVAEHSRKYLISKKIPSQKIITIHNGLEPQCQNTEKIVRSTVGLKDTDIVIGIASRLEPVKGVKHLLEAFSRVSSKLPNVRLLIVGWGTQEEILKQLSIQIGISENTLFVGFQDNVDDWLEIFDIFVLPSLSEYHSIALLEAMRAGKGIVATSVGGNPESVRHEKHALVVPPADVTALEDAIIRLVLDSEFRHRLGSNAKQRFFDEFTEERMLKKTAHWLLSFQSR